MVIDKARPYSLHIHHLYVDLDDPGCPSRYIQVIVYPDVESMRAAADRYRGTSGDYAEAAGCFQGTAFKSRYDRKTKSWVDTSGRFAGVMRVVGDHPKLRNILIHEATHVAVQLMRMHEWSKPGADNTCDLGTECGEAEENLCYLVGNITDLLIKKLIDGDAD